MSDAARIVATVSATAAKDLNDDLTIALASAEELLERAGPLHPFRDLLLENRAAIQKAAWHVEELLRYSIERKQGQRIATPFTRLIESER